MEPGERIENHSNADAFAQPAPGTLTRNLAVGPAFRQVDLAISRLISVGTQRMELRFETFDLFDT